MLSMLKYDCTYLWCIMKLVLIFLGLLFQRSINMMNTGSGSGGFENRERHRSRENDSHDSDTDSSAELNQDAPLSINNRRRKYHRHSPHQIQNLEALFKECPHPDESQRIDLSRKISLESQQVKFWFQNRRTQMKTHLERHENNVLRQENDKLRTENMSLREAMRKHTCINCGNPAVIGEIPLEEQQLRIENARLKDEIDRLYSLTGKFFGHPIFPNFSDGASSSSTPMPNPSLGLEIGGGNGRFCGYANMHPPSFPIAPQNFVSQPGGVMDPMGSSSMERSLYFELGTAAVEELVKLVQSEAQLWTRTVDEFNETLNYEEYLRVFPRCIGPKPVGFVSEATRASATVMTNSTVLVETLMDVNCWVDMFSCSVSKASTTNSISYGLSGTRHCALQLMRAELRALSPLVPIREANFLRFCKQLAEGVWAVVDVSIDGIIHGNPSAMPNSSFTSCRKLPSGCVIQDFSNGQSKVTWVEHTEYDESNVHEMCRSLVRSGGGFGANKWVSTLKRQCQTLAFLISSIVSPVDLNGIAQMGRRSLLKLAHRMTDSFYKGVCPSAHIWTQLSAGEEASDVRVMVRKSFNNPGEPTGIVLNGASSVWLPVLHARLFEYLRDVGLRSDWDILSNGSPMHEMAFVAKGRDSGNRVSLIRASVVREGQPGMLILQETTTDESGSLVVYAPVDIPAMHVAMKGGDSTYIALLPSGFAIVPDIVEVLKKSGDDKEAGGDGHGDKGKGKKPELPESERVVGSILTMSFQILVNSVPTDQMPVESVETVKTLIACTVEKIKAAMSREI